MKKIRALYKEVDKEPYIAYLISSEEAMQGAIGGTVKILKIMPDMAVLSNANAESKELPFNCKVWGDKYYGTIVIAGLKGGELSDIPLFTYELKRIFPNLWDKEKTAHDAATP